MDESAFEVGQDIEMIHGLGAPFFVNAVKGEGVGACSVKPVEFSGGAAYGKKGLCFSGPKKFFHTYRISYFWLYLVIKSPIFERY